MCHKDRDQISNCNIKIRKMLAKIHLVLRFWIATKYITKSSYHIKSLCRWNTVKGWNPATWRTNFVTIRITKGCAFSRQHSFWRLLFWHAKRWSRWHVCTAHNLQGQDVIIKKVYLQKFCYETISCVIKAKLLKNIMGIDLCPQNGKLLTHIFL